MVCQVNGALGSTSIDLVISVETTSYPPKPRCLDAMVQALARWFGRRGGGSRLCRRG
ncbi:hypothetical protein FHX73_12147 [Kitasatospora viridis]|uniref:Uncharacterized protein n=1 Tax=Kitasatospora viridis TaxID=281105 RepID=A0A561TVA6_9ACTN|nr:hypothetical protein FHX73_12147 [Kitasatospora viridis]